MKLSAKSRYAIRAVVFIGLNASEKNHVSLKEISEKEDISIKYLEQIFTALKKEGIVNSIKGSYGGYVLAEEKREITIGRIIRAVEGSIQSVEAHEKNHMKKHSIEYYMISKFWEPLDIVVNNYLNSKNLEDIIKEYSEINGKTDDELYLYRSSYI